MTESNFGKIHVYTGLGKGKTTASLGLAIRALGYGKKVAIIYFDKGGSYYSERNILDELAGDNFQYYVTGQERFNPRNQTFRSGLQKADLQEAQKGLNIVEDLFVEALVDLLVLDEINSAIHLRMLDLETFLKILDKKPKYMELVLTGRQAHSRILQRADLVTEMKSVKHYYDQGVVARGGIEY